MLRHASGNVIHIFMLTIRNFPTFNYSVLWRVTLPVTGNQTPTLGLDITLISPFFPLVPVPLWSWHLLCFFFQAIKRGTRVSGWTRTQQGSTLAYFSSTINIFPPLPNTQPALLRLSDFSSLKQQPTLYCPPPPVLPGVPGWSPPRVVFFLFFWVKVLNFLNFTFNWERWNLIMYLFIQEFFPCFS